jgi:hypothetical protein
MALSYSTRHLSPERGTAKLDGRQAQMARITFDSSYTTGGLAVTASSLRMSRVDQIIPLGLAVNAALTAGIFCRYEISTGKLVAYWPQGSGAALAEVTNGTDLSAYTVDVLVIGKPDDNYGQSA